MSQRSSKDSLLMLRERWKKQNKLHQPVRQWTVAQLVHSISQMFTNTNLTSILSLNTVIYFQQQENEGISFICDNSVTTTASQQQRHNNSVTTQNL